MQEEHKWIQEVLKGDQQAYIHIIEKYKEPLYGIILRMTRNPHDAQDLVQEVFIKVYERLGQYEEKGSFKSWFYRVATNHCMDQFRKKRLVSSEMTDNLIVNEQHPEVIFLKKEKERRLEKLIATLPEDERLIILLRYRQELTYEEISDSTGYPLSTVRNKLHRAKKKMRKKMKEGKWHDDLSNY